MEDIGLVTFVMTTGSRGLHVVAPLDRSEEFDSVRSFARSISEVLAGRHPEEMTVEQHKDRRGGSLFLDTVRNSYGQTSVAPYSVRAKDGAPVATPLHWEVVCLIFCNLAKPCIHSVSTHSQSINTCFQ